jgi:GTP-binding protein Era
MDAPGQAAAPSFRCGCAALLGWTNVGKSTLLNRLVGEKVAAVAAAPQTTRGRILGVANLPGFGQAVFLDTPGLHRPRHRMNREMLRVARDSLAGADLEVLVVDAARGLGAGDEEAAGLLRQSGRPSLVAINKIDRLRAKSALLPMIETLVARWGLDEAMPISALTGEGCAELLRRIVERLPAGPPLFPEETFTDQPERLLAAEWIREKLLHHTREELPHATAVLVEGWRTRQDGLVEIEATILVERETQKAIVIGRDGGLLKQVGSEARRDLESLLGARVFLRLWVKVRPRWRDDEATLRMLGLT